MRVWPPAVRDGSQIEVLFSLIMLHGGINVMESASSTVHKKMCLVRSKSHGGCLNIKMSSYQYRDPRVKDKTVSRSSFLQHGNPHTWERWSLYWDGAMVSIWCFCHHRFSPNLQKYCPFVCNDCSCRVNSARLWQPVTLAVDQYVFITVKHIWWHTDCPLTGDNYVMMDGLHIEMVSLWLIGDCLQTVGGQQHPFMRKLVEQGKLKQWLRTIMWQVTIIFTRSQHTACPY